MNHIKKIVVLLPVAMLLTGLLTAIMTSVSIQPEQAFIPTWLEAFTFAFLIMLPCGGVIFYFVNKAVQQMFGSFTVLQRNLIHGLTMAFIMETILALVTTASNRGFPSFELFFKEAALSLVAALPIGIAMACLMSLVVKPKLEAHFASGTNA
ncbi:DUF2798 domain-containing protein [Aliiglaciecola sp. 3_MG-2023]|uniref:DUF2798 domain-containing protein n=1 Tax=Aliiglaciecola sp. 3_MG-2023 TaxID=3062644 RepID=UPI0026E39AC7|nr:DUF2798 domain-containing protein [Aliiglaciecola sp. 3_MG-2023]MDO6694251.1 DUF2798 domain-containing protein [Aliiglaciecola sp. 3_MG-2023]